MLRGSRFLPLLFWLVVSADCSAILNSNIDRRKSSSQLTGLSPAERTASVLVQEVDNHWISNVTIGGQTVLLCIDTGSSPLWLSARDTGSDQGHGYHVNQSLTAKSKLDIAFNISFPHAWVSGVVVEDDVSLANNSISVEDFAFGVANQESSNPLDEPWDGLLGLGFHNISVNGGLVTLTRLIDLVRLTGGKIHYKVYRPFSNH